MSDQDLPPDPSEDDQPSGAVGHEAKPEIDVTLLPELPVHPRSQRMPGSNLGRWATFGCVVVMLILVVLLVIGVSLTKRTVWIAYAKGQQQLVENLPPELESGERMRIERNLQRFRARLEITADPFPAMGDFLGRVKAAFDDEVLSVEELAELNRFIEESLDQDGADLR